MPEPISTALTLLALRPILSEIAKNTNTFLSTEFEKRFNLKKFSINNQQLVDSIEKIGLVKTLFTGAEKPVDLHSFFYTPSITTRNGISKIHCLDQITTEHSILIEATVGQGKSILMRYLALQEASKNSRIPIFIELKNISKEKSLEYLIQEKIEAWTNNIKNEQVKFILQSGNVSLFLDAFDEISKDFIPDTLSTIEKLANNFSNLKLIVSSRPDSEIKHSSYFEIIKVNSYDDEDRQNLIEKIVTEKEAQEQLIKSIQNTTPEVKSVLITPLMIGLYIRKYTSDFTPPERIVDFYKNIFDLVSITHDKSKGWDRESESKLNRDDLELIFERFCFEMFLEDKLLFGQALFIEKIKKSLVKYELTTSPYLVMNDFTKYLCLILQDGTEFTFIHRSIHEFYLAKFISKLEIENAKKIFNKKIKPIVVDNLTFFISHLNKYFYYKLFLLPIFETVKENSFFQFNYLKNNQIPQDILSYFECVAHDFDEFFISSSSLIKFLIHDSDNKQELIYFLNSYIFESMYDNEHYKLSHTINGIADITNPKFTKELHKHMNENLKFQERLEHLTLLYNDINRYIEIKENEVTDEDLSDI